jgi:hypothetical protein
MNALLSNITRSNLKGSHHNYTRAEKAGWKKGAKTKADKKGSGGYEGPKVAEDPNVARSTINNFEL